MAIRNTFWRAASPEWQKRQPMKTRRNRKAYSPQLCIECQERWKQFGDYCRRCDPVQKNTREREKERVDRMFAKLLQGAILIDPLLLEPRPNIDIVIEGQAYEIVWDGA